MDESLGRHPSRVACLLLEQPEDPDLQSGIQERLLELAMTFSPTVEDGEKIAEEPGSGRGLIRLDVRGLGRLYPTPKVLLEALLDAAEAAGLHRAVAAIADGPFTSAVLARAVAASACPKIDRLRKTPGRLRSPEQNHRPPRFWVSSPGDDRTSLAPLPLQLLSAPEMAGLTSKSMEQLALLAVRTAGGFAALPSSTIERRFGKRGLLLQRLARGEDRRPLRPWRPLATFIQSAELEDPVEALPALRVVLEPLLENLFRDLAKKTMGATRLEVVYSTRSKRQIRREVDVLEPGTDPKAWLEQLLIDVEAQPLGGPVSRIQLEARHTTELAPRSLELLFAGGGGNQEGVRASRPAPASSSPPKAGELAPFPIIDKSPKLAKVAARLRARLGPSGVGTPTLADRHRPESAFHIEPAIPSNMVRTDRGASKSSGRTDDTAAGFETSPALAIRLLSPRAVSVETDADGRPARVEGRPAASAGPFPVSGEWWTSPYDRLYFEVATSAALLWIFQDGLDGRWYVHGVFD